MILVNSHISTLSQQLEEKLLNASTIELNLKWTEAASTDLEGRGGTSGAGVPSPTPFTPLDLEFCFGGSSGGSIDTFGGSIPALSVP